MGLERYFWCFRGVLPFAFCSSDRNQNGAVFDRKLQVQSGEERIYRMFSVDESGSLSPELLAVYQNTIFGALMGATFGGFMESKSSTNAIQKTKTIVSKTKVKFDEQYASSVGKNVVSAFFRGAFHWGWRGAFLFGSLTLFSSATSVYRGKSGIVEYSMVGAILGPLYFWKRGVKAMALGGLAGIVLGTAGGCITLAVKSLGGTTTEETMFWQYGWQENQLRNSKERIQKLKEESRQLMKNDDL